MQKLILLALSLLLGEQFLLDSVRMKGYRLVDIEALPESEKVYDRNTSIDTLKFIIKQGFRIIKE